ncbi:MFS transporter [Myxococcota bacterium]|nr:MFS transporter [Myxococcota bacterium]
MTAPATEETAGTEAEKKGPPNPLRDFWNALVATRHLGPVFWVCNLVFMLDGAAYFGVLNVLTLFVGKELQLSDRWGGYYVSGFTASVTIFSVLLGGLTDKLGVRRTLTVTIIAALLGRALLASSPSLPGAEVMAAIGLFVMAFSAGAMQPAVYAGVKQVTDSKTAAMGFSLLYALMNGGSMLESIASSLVREHHGVVGVMWMCAGITLTYWLVHTLGFPKNAGERVVAAVKSATAAAAPKAGWREHPLLDPRFIFFIFILLPVRTLFVHQWLTLPDYVTRAYPPEVGARYEWVAGLNPTIILFGTPFVAAVTSKVHVVKMMALGTFVSATSVFLLVPGPNLTALLISQIVFSVGEAMWSSRFYEWIADAAPSDRVGMYMGVALIPWFLAKATTGLYSGYMLELFCPANGPQSTGTLWLIYGAVALVSPIGLLAAGRWLKAGVGKKPPEPAAA